ncbi:MAG: phosphoglucosamine mutase [Verrucomicrobiota bacterium]
MSTQLFGTDGIRGRANRHPLTPAIATRLGLALCREFAPVAAGQPVLIGRDTRRSGPMLEQALAAGVLAGGGQACLLGVLPTPAVALLVREWGAGAGVMISASHNPFEDNGLKVFQADGYKCDDATEEKIEGHLLAGDEAVEALLADPARIGGLRPAEDAAGTFCELARERFADSLRLDGLTIAVDAANGASYQTTPQVLESLGAKVLLHHAEPDGLNINAGCGSTHPETIASLVKESGADLGISHDGDADRVVFCDETGDPLDGDEVLAILGRRLQAEGKLAGGELVATVMSNLGLDEAMRAAGIGVRRAAVGDRHVLEEMRAHGLNLGGEQSGHIILSDFNTTGDGLNTALQLLRSLREQDQPLSQLRRVMHKYPQRLVNVKVRAKPALEEIPGLPGELRAVEAELGDAGRVLLRYSGTEPKLRLLLEARAGERLDALAERILSPIRQAIGDEG